MFGLLAALRLDVSKLLEAIRGCYHLCSQNVCPFMTVMMDIACVIRNVVESFPLFKIHRILSFQTLSEQQPYSFPCPGS